MPNKIFVPIGQKKDDEIIYTLHEVLLFSKAPPDETWIIAGAGKTYTDFLKKLKKGLYHQHLGDEFRGLEFRLDPHMSLPETAESVLLGICVKAEKEIKMQGLKDHWASVTLTGKVTVEVEDKEPVFLLTEGKHIDEKHAALVKRVKEEAGDEKTDSPEKHLFVYVSDKKIALSGENEVLSENIHIERFPSKRPLQEVFELLFAPMVSSEGGLYFENHTIYERFDQIYGDIRKYNKMKKEDEMPYYKDDKITFTKKNYWQLIPEDIRKDDEENCKRYRDLFFSEIDPYIRMDYPVKRFFKKAPFIIAEHYFYYDILKKFCIQPGLVSRKDPYAREKQSFTRKKPKKHGNEGNTKDYLKEIFKKLSNIKKSEAATKNDIGWILKTLIDIIGTDQSQIHHRQNINTTDLIIDDREEFLQYLSREKEYRNIKRIDIILDNYGLEFIYVIVLALNIMKYCGGEEDFKIYFHLKVWPIYVSDVIKSEYGNDVDNIKEQIGKMPKNENLLSDLLHLEEEDQIIWQPDMFWNTHLPFRAMPQKLKDGFAESDLVIVMSDLNYRKLIEDREWSCDTKIEDKIRYLSAPVLIVRALKSNSLISISPDQAREYKEKYDSEWRTTGQLGIIQFVDMRKDTQ